MMESSHSEEFPGAGSSAQPDQVSNTEDEVELIEFFTFASESDAGDEDFSRRNQANEEEEDEVTQDPLPTVRPFLQFGCICTCYAWRASRRESLSCLATHELSKEHGKTATERVFNLRFSA